MYPIADGTKPAWSRNGLNGCSGVAMPLMTGVYYLMLFATTRAFLHEPIGAGHVLGVILVVSGVYLLTLKAA